MSEQSWDQFFAAVSRLEALRNRPQGDRLLRAAVRQLDQLLERPVVMGQRSHGEDW